VAGTESDLCVGGAASASSSAAGHAAALAFDDDLGTYWITAPGFTTGWLEYDLAVAKNVKRYRIYKTGAAAPSDPKDWNFQVFTGGGWVSLDTVTGYAFAADSWADFYVANPYTETDYRLNVTANNGNPIQMGLFEMEYYLGDEGASVIMYPENQSVNAAADKLMLHVSMGRSVGMGVQYPGFYEVLAQQDPGRWYATFQAELEDTFGTILEERTWFARLYKQTQEGYRSAAQAERTVTIGS